MNVTSPSSCRVDLQLRLSCFAFSYSRWYPFSFISKLESHVIHVKPRVLGHVLGFWSILTPDIDVSFLWTKREGGGYKVIVWWSNPKNKIQKRKGCRRQCFYSARERDSTGRVESDIEELDVVEALAVRLDAQKLGSSRFIWDLYGLGQHVGLTIPNGPFIEPSLATQIRGLGGGWRVQTSQVWRNALTTSSPSVYWRWSLSGYR